jgi:hypothetical protein
MALNDLGYKKVKVSRLTHYEIGVDKKSDKLIDDLIKSGVLLNTNKEIPYIDDWSTSKPKAHKILVRYKDDFDGQGKLNTLNKRLGLTQVNSVKKGILWQIECQEADWQKILKSNILFNPYSQEALIYRES